MSSMIWRKSSYSGESGGQCVEIALDAGAIRDSKSPDGPVLHLTPEALTAFIASVK